MTLFANWLSESNDPDLIPANQEAERAALAWRRITHKPTTVEFRKPNEDVLPAQIVRLEYENLSLPEGGVAGQSVTRRLMIFGIRNHPYIPDTDIAEQYRFYAHGDEYVVTDVIMTLGEIQANAEANG